MSQDQPLESPTCHFYVFIPPPRLQNPLIQGISRKEQTPPNITNSGWKVWKGEGRRLSFHPYRSWQGCRKSRHWGNPGRSCVVLASATVWSFSQAAMLRSFPDETGLTLQCQSGAGWVAASPGTSRHRPGTFPWNMTCITLRWVLEVVYLVVRLELRWER